MANGIEDEEQGCPPPVIEDNTVRTQFKRTEFEVRTVNGPVTKENWFKTYYRPALAWAYLLMLLFDFIIAPVLTMILPKFIAGMAYVPWHPLTLEGGGLVHVALGAIIGVTAWGRTKEKMADVRD